MDLLQLLLGSMTNQSSVGSVSGKTGLSDKQVKKLMALAIPLLIKYMTKNASSGNGAQSLLGALAQHTSQKDMADQLGDADEEDGGKIISHILGSNQSQVTQDLSAQTGLDSSQISQVLAIMAPALMSGVSNAASTTAAAGNAGSRKPGKTYAGKTPGDGEHRSGRPSYAGREDGERRKPRPPYAAKAGGDGEHRKPSRPYAGKSSGDSERRSSRPPFAGKPAAEGENRNPGKPYAGKRPAGTNLRRPDPLRRREPEVKEVHFVQQPAVVTVRPNPDHVSFDRNVASGCLVIGVTGGIGAGKSEVLRILQEKYGAAVIRSDEVAKELMKKGGPAYPFYREILGEGILGPDGEVDSSRASGLLFADPGKVRRLNEAVHPLVKEEIKNRVEALKKSGKDLIAIESALLAEGGLNDLTDTVWFVDTPEEIRIKRLQDSRGYTEEHCRSVMSRQRTVQQYRREADLVIHNEGIPVDLEDQVSSAMHQYRRRFTAR